MKGKPWLRYLATVLLIAMIVFLRAYVESVIETEDHMRLFGAWKYIIYGMVMCIAIGLLLGAEHLFGEIKKEGKWELNLPKIILLGLPALYLSLADIVYMPIHLLEFVNNSPLGVIFDPWIAIAMNRCYTEYITLIQVLLGYVVITSFYKGSKRVLTHYR